MDLLEQLALDFPPIKKEIMRYSSKGGIIEYLNELAAVLSVEPKKLDAVEHCVSEICDWFNKQYSNIEENALVYNREELQNCKSKIDKYKIELNAYVLLPQQETKRDTYPIIFLSHKSDDKKYGDALEKLITGLGIKNDQLIYTSHPLHKIPLGQNIYDYLRSKITSNVYMIFLWSNKYLESPACMNEMGAAWVSKSDYTNLYTPDFKFGNPKYHECAVDIRKMGAVLKPDQNCRQSMIELRDTIVKMFNLTVDERTWTYLLDNFITEIGEAEKQGGEK
jgi:hypothetical protein